MKKIIVGITAMLITAGAYAQVDPKQYPVTTDTIVYKTTNDKHPDGYMMKNGKMMCINDQKMTWLKNDTTLMNGTIVMSNGNFIRKGETKTKFKEGQHMDLTGKMVMMPKSTDQVKKSDGTKKIYLVKDTTRNERNQK